MSEDRFIAEHAAATLDGTKASSLLCLRTVEGGRLSDGILGVLRESGVESLPLTNRLSCPLMLLYRRDLLEKVLGTPEVRGILASSGYGDLSLEGALTTLAGRFRAVPCPDEVGVFLGYPPRDVRSYIEKGGRDPIYSGYWKVYHDPEGARALEECYMCSRRRMTEKIDSGLSLREVLAA